MWVVLVSLGVELLRRRFHPESGWPLLAAGLAANLGYHAWSMPRDTKRTIVSAVLGEASMPVIIGLLIQLIKAIVGAVLVFLNQFFPGV